MFVATIKKFLQIYVQKIVQTKTFKSSTLIYREYSDNASALIESWLPEGVRVELTPVLGDGRRHNGRTGKGVSSAQLARDIHVTQKTAWFILHKVRSLYTQDDSVALEGGVECDEMYLGGREKNKHQSKKTEHTQGKSLKTKTLVTISDGAGRYDIGEDDGCYVIYKDRQHSEDAMYIFPELHKELNLNFRCARCGINFDISSRNFNFA